MLEEAAAKGELHALAGEGHDEDDVALQHPRDGCDSRPDENDIKHLAAGGGLGHFRQLVAGESGDVIDDMLHEARRLHVENEHDHAQGQTRAVEALERQ